MKLDQREVPTDVPACWQCGFRPLVQPKDDLVGIEVRIENGEPVQMWLCEDCADEIAVDLGARHLLEEAIEA